MAKTVSEAKLPTPRMAAPRAVRLSPSADRVGRVEHQERPPVVADVFLEDRHQRPRLAKRGGLVDDDPAGLLAGGRGGVQLADDLLRRNGAEQEVLEHRHRQRRNVGRRLPGVESPPNLSRNRR